MHIINDSLSDVVQSDETKILYGRDYIYEDILGLRFKISLFSFFQTNTLGAEVLYEKAREYIMETDAFIDGEPIGVVTWDSRNCPEYVEIGHNSWSIYF
ncbi:hypothetical protein SAMN02745111_01552 [Eubacterium uniforme]|uniref:Uncharacterized protein n=1 Tax=Eubacterium uniforme TaxID=39495 RepID=A0A1T4VTG3_9FIRM|nr:hypothetical protein SAMN02745111_01552 [Eubacterium uniforme]